MSFDFGSYIVIWSPENDWKHHLQLLCKVFVGLADADVTVNLSKIHFARTSIKYLGHIVGVRPDPAETAAVIEILLN